MFSKASFWNIKYSWTIFSVNSLFPHLNIARKFPRYLAAFFFFCKWKKGIPSTHNTPSWKIVVASFQWVNYCTFLQSHLEKLLHPGNSTKLLLLKASLCLPFCLIPLQYLAQDLFYNLSKVCFQFLRPHSTLLLHFFYFTISFFYFIFSCFSPDSKTSYLFFS